MLTLLRKASKGWVSKILLLLLVLSFAIWGISDQVNGVSAGGAVVTAGDTKVSAIEYRLAYDRQISAASQQIGQRISPEQARLFGIERQVVASLVGGAVLDEQARDMKLGLSEDRLAGLIAEDQAFQGLTGQFDRNQFRLVLRNVGMSETDYITSREQAAKRQQIVEAVSDGMKVPATFMTALAQFQGQTRDVTFIEVDESTLAQVAAPTDDVLKSYFEANKEKYRAPEFRAFKMVRLTAADIADPKTIADTAIRAEYDNNIERYTTAETRTIQQLVFADIDAANIARERILAGATFESEVEAAGRKISDATLGTFSKAQAPSVAIGDAAFGLQSTTDISGVIDGAFGPILVRVSEIKPEVRQPFTEVSDSIRNDLALLEAQEILLNVHDSYEDARAAGSTMDEAAAAQKLNVKTIAEIDRQGLNNEGNAVDLGNESGAIIPAVFEAEIDLENPPLAAGRDGFIWYELTGVKEARDRTLDEVSDRVSQDWITDEKNRLLDEEAKRLVDALTAGTDAAALAAEKSYRNDVKFGLARDANDADFGQAGVQEVFSVGPNGAGFSTAPSGNRRLIFKVTDIKNPIGGVESLPAQQVDNVGISLQGDILDQLVNRLQLEFPVTINQAAIQRATAQ